MELFSIHTLLVLITSSLVSNTLVAINTTTDLQFLCEPWEASPSYQLSLARRPGNDSQNELFIQVFDNDCDSLGSATFRGEQAQDASVAGLRGGGDDRHAYSINLTNSSNTVLDLQLPMNISTSAQLEKLELDTTLHVPNLHSLTWRYNCTSMLDGTVCQNQTAPESTILLLWGGNDVGRRFCGCGAYGEACGEGWNSCCSCQILSPSEYNYTLSD